MNRFATTKFLCFLLFVSVSGDTVRSSAPAVVPGICELMIEIYGYRCEEHTVTTEDGYILSLQRIPHGRTDAAGGPQKTPVLLQHGVFMDGITWFLNSRDDSLGYILADSGYDVWIANGRGTIYSRRHNESSTHNSTYWDWSWDELAAYDLPATYEYVYNHSGRKKVHYIAHSLGTLMALASFSQMNLVNMTRSAAFLSPIAYLNNIKSPLARFVARGYLAEVYYKLGFVEFIPYEGFLHNLAKELCKFASRPCFDLVTSFTGKNCCLNSSSIYIFLKHEPQSTSAKNLVHLSQMVRRGTITKFDYENDDENIKHYGQSNPPPYDISAFPKNLPLFIAHGGQDGLSDVEDVKHLLEGLNLHDNKSRVIYEPEYAHGDFIMGSNARKIVYEPLVHFLNSH